MSRPKVFVTRTIASSALKMLEEVATVEVWPEPTPVPTEVLLAKSQDIDGLLVLASDKCDATLIESSKRLKVISNFGVGYNNVDVASAIEHGVFVGYTPGVVTETTADLAFALLMAAARQLVQGDNLVRSGGWRSWGPMDLLGCDIHHATLGIVGLGRIGAEVAKRAKGFDMTVLYHDEARREDVEAQLGVQFVPTLSHLLSAADYISLHVPLNENTLHLIGESEFALMKPNAILVNASRGPVVDQNALCKALKTHQIFGAAIDVAEVEPIPTGDPLLALDNLTVSPHVGTATLETRTNQSLMAADNLVAALMGRVPPHCVNPEARRAMR